MGLFLLWVTRGTTFCDAVVQHMPMSCPGSQVLARGWSILAPMDTWGTTPHPTGVSAFRSCCLVRIRHSDNVHSLGFTPAWELFFLNADNYSFRPY